MTAIKVLLGQILNGFAALGVFAPLAFMVAYIFGTVLFIPTAILTFAAGALFGVPMGRLVAYSGAFLAAVGRFLAGRYLSRG